MVRLENGQNLPSHRRVGCQKFSHLYIFSYPVKDNLPRIFREISHITFPSLKVLDLSIDAIESIEQVGRLNTPALEDLKIGTIELT